MSHSSSPATGVCAKQVAYLAGPMRGYAEYNFPAFNAAAAKLRGHGLDVWSPAEHDVNEDGFDPAKDTHQPMKHYMRRDLPAVLDADMVCVLPGWEKSQGACLEVLVAQTCGIPVYVAETMQPIPSKPSETAPNSAMEDVWTVARLLAEGSDWKRDQGETISAWLQRRLSSPSATRRIDLTRYVNAASIGGADCPHEVVEKLQRSIDAATRPFEMPTLGEILLACGEMKAGELRAAKAALTWFIGRLNG